MKVATDSLRFKKCGKGYLLRCRYVEKIKLKEGTKNNKHKFIHLRVPIYVVNSTSYCFDFK